MITRTAWGKMFCFCFVCGYSTLDSDRLETHEIARGPHRKGAFKEPSTWIRTCNGAGNDCHHRKLDGMSIAKQLAIKLRFDKEHYDRQRVNVLRGRRPNAVSKADVAKAMRTLKE